MSTKKHFSIAIVLLLVFGIFAGANIDKKTKTSLLIQYTVYGVVPKDKYWILYSAENRSTVGVFYFINGQQKDPIYTGCHPYCYKNWPEGLKLLSGESVGIAGGNGIYYQYNEYPVSGLK